MLTFEDYRLLEEDLQVQVLSMDGVYLGLIRPCRNRNVELYALYHFYVEIFFEAESGEPLYLRPFQKMSRLEPYLAMVDIDSLVNIKEEGQ
jgi:hypothetical protein